MHPKKTKQGLGLLTKGGHDDNPLTVLANLFETGIVFALGFMVALLNANHLLNMMDPNAKVTVTTERKDGMEIVTKEGNKTTIRRMTKNLGSGDGQRLGIAYKLEDGSVIYVPEDSTATGK